jgi:ATP-dependent exoDNAse (exonuclease V) beta subunit
VLTIHKAKGLDFAHVYLLQHHKGAGRGGDEVKARVVPRDGGFEYWLLRAGAATPGFEQVALDARAVEEAERVRTLYVATTRAKDRLVVSGSWPDRERRRGGRREGSHAQLLAARDPAPPDLEALAAGLSADRPAQEEGGARWFLPALVVPAEDQEADAPRDAELPGAARVRRESEELLAARARAREHALRPFAAVASARAGKGDDETESARRYAEEIAPEESARLEIVPRERARAVGTAVHRALELLDPTLAPDAALSDSMTRAQDSLALLLGPGEREAALASAREILERFVRGPLFARLRELAPHVVARELPVLLSPERPDAGPVGFVSGAIDLVYRDPATAELVVVDYKTDRLEGPSELAERAASYRAQGAEYQRALRQALVLDAAPRFELWFLHAGRVVVTG